MKVNLLEVATEVRQVERVGGFTRVWSPLSALSATKASSTITLETFYVIYELQVESGDLGKKANIELDFAGKKHTISNINHSAKIDDRIFEWCLLNGFSCDICSDPKLTVNIELDGHILETLITHVSVQ